MRTIQRTLAVIAFLILATQTIRHAYLLWLEPRGSALDKYDQPLKGEISGAETLDQLLARYDAVKKEVEQADKERSQRGQRQEFQERYEREPYKSERMLREAITGWEAKTKEIHALRFYWVVGLVLSALGLAASVKWNHWWGLSVLITGFSEIIYWTSPTFFGSASREFDRLLVQKLVFSVLSLLLLVVVVVILRAFADEQSRGARKGPAA